MICPIMTTYESECECFRDKCAMWSKDWECCGLRRIADNRDSMVGLTLKMEGETNE